MSASGPSSTSAPGGPQAIAEAAARRKRRRRCSATTISCSSSRPTTRRAARCGWASDPWPWPTGRSCSTGCRSRWAGPASTACSAPRTSSRTCCCSASLDDKVVIGSMNRGGLAGTVFEIDDRFTGYDAATIARMGFDGGKMLFRIDPDDPATALTMESCAQAVSDLAAHGLMAMVEPFISHRVDGRVRNDLSPEAVTRSIAVASGLGATSAYTWLKVPVVERHGAGSRRVHAAGPAARRRGQRRPGRRLRGAGGRRCRCRRCTGWSSAGRCCSRPTTTSPARSTPPSAWCGGDRGGREALPAAWIRRRRRLLAGGDARARRMGLLPACAC